ncbi:MAG: hypothetical protein JRI84_15705, partial [Deltaproteobacteria bacterium]|nr:hypothetical protein [Deltaproteobacteria bacterium]
DQLIGHKLKVAGGALKSIEETGAPAGTSVEVRDLFYNTPARRKFLRAINTETAHIIDTVLRVALPYTDIYFRLEEGERVLLNLPPSKNLSNRLVTVFGRNVAGALIEGARDFEGFQIEILRGFKLRPIWLLRIFQEAGGIVFSSMLTGEMSEIDIFPAQSWPVTVSVS